MVCWVVHLQHHQYKYSWVCFANLTLNEGTKMQMNRRLGLLQHGLSHYVIWTCQTIPSFIFSCYTFHLHHPQDYPLPIALCPTLTIFATPFTLI